MTVLLFFCVALILSKGMHGAVWFGAGENCELFSLLRGNGK